MKHPEARLARVIEAFETLDRAALERFNALYAADATFKDPFNEVRGVVAIRRIFEHMFDTLDAPRFVIRDAVLEGDQAFLTWDFLFRPRRRGATEMCVRGATQLWLDAQGRITVHRDYWDAAEELYEKLPLLGALMRWLKRRVSA